MATPRGKGLDAVVGVAVVVVVVLVLVLGAVADKFRQVEKMQKGIDAEEALTGKRKRERERERGTKRERHRETERDRERGIAQPRAKKTQRETQPQPHKGSQLVGSNVCLQPFAFRKWTMEALAQAALAVVVATPAWKVARSLPPGAAAPNCFAGSAGA